MNSGVLYGSYIHYALDNLQLVHSEPEYSAD